jgi:hypothetical protein
MHGDCGQQTRPRAEPEEYLLVLERLDGRLYRSQCCPLVLPVLVLLGGVPVVEPDVGVAGGFVVPVPVGVPVEEPVPVLEPVAPPAPVGVPVVVPVLPGVPVPVVPGVPVPVLEPVLPEVEVPVVPVVPVAVELDPPPLAPDAPPEVLSPSVGEPPPVTGGCVTEVDGCGWVTTCADFND